MVRDRLELHNILLDILGLPYVYFQAPESYRLDFPCIMYKLGEIDSIHANDKRYLNMKRYLVTIVDEDPDSEIPDKLLELPYCKFEDHFAKDDLNHYIFSLYY